MPKMSFSRHLFLMIGSFAAFFSYLWISDHFWPVYNWGDCKTVQQAKNQKVFVKEYKPIKNPYPINQAISLPIKEAWLEKGWRTTLFNDTIIDPKIYCLVLKVNFKTLESYKTWNIDTGFSSFGSSEPTDDFSCLVKNYYWKIPDEDTLAFPVVEKNGYEPSNKVIGNFVLVAIK